MSIKLKGSTDGSVSLDAPSDTSPTGTDVTLTLPTSAGSANQFLKNSGTAGTLEYSSLIEDSSGRLLVGTSSALSNLSYEATATLSPQIQLVGSNASTAHLGIVRTSGGGPADLTLGWGSSGNLAAANQDVGALLFSAFDGSVYRNAAYIQCEADGAHAAGDTPGRLVFSTTADGASYPTERMRINSSGQIFVNTTSQIASGYLLNIKMNSLAGGIAIQNYGSSNTAMVFRNSTDTSTVGYISTGNTSTSYSTSSDYRLKENVVSLSGGIARVKQLNPNRFNFIAEPDITVDGFLAHEVQSVVPEAITGTKDEVDDDGNPVMQGIDQSKLVPLLTAALQEAIAKIETLEQRLSDAGIA